MSLRPFTVVVERGRVSVFTVRCECGRSWAGRSDPHDRLAAMREAKQREHRLTCVISGHDCSREEAVL